ncbi:transglycosylase domain-containing protein [Calothrix sp. 336/3]|uniref:transglycosylase domain-containing protein n=1 Tax=Calothrix sp. 336/3 TaxID=1337936 RepID=UPI000AB0891D|nr:penicillin-binding protein 1A [Calothrix sp. 336/3]
MSGSDIEKPASPEGDQEQNPASNNPPESSPPPVLVKGKQVLHRLQTVSSAILDKLPGRGKPLYRRYWFWAGITLGGGAIATSYGIWTIDKSLPDRAELSAVVREQTLTIQAADGTIIQQQGEATREQLKLEEIPEKLRQAFIASEDRRFANHDGVDYQGVVRAVVNNLRSKDVVEGGSSITQQLSRILFLKQEKTVWRKLKEARLAQKMEQVLTKDEILERYLNLVYLGSGAYGVADAAQVYFSKTVDQLTLSEMATIAALPPAPNRFSPVVNLELTQQRRNLVLQRMLEDKIITPSEKESATNEAITLKASPPKRWQVEAPYFISYVQKELPKYVPPEALKQGGLTVETSLNLDWQRAAEKAVSKTLKNQGRWENFKEAALVAIDPRNGQIKAMVGGKDFNNTQFNRVTQAQRQPGSTFKGFVYAAAIATGISPYDSFQDSPLIVDGYEPKNFDEGYRGWINMRDALTKSVNIVAVRIIMRVGFQPTINLAHAMGIKSELKPMYSLALGSNEVNLLEITSAYGTFANQGLHVEPHGITRILNRQGKVIWTANFQPKVALDAESNAIMTWMMRNVVNAGTGQAAQLNNRQVAGKTGTTDEARDLWFIGFIPQLVTGVWLGNDNNKPTWGSSSTAAYTWHEFMKVAVEGMPIEKFPARPEKLEGRKGSIKAEPIKARRLVNRSIPSRDSEQESNDESSNRRRRRGEYNNSDESNNSDRPSRRRRRRYNQENQTNSENTSRSERRSSRRRQSSEESSPTSETPRRRRRVESDTPAPSRRSNSNSDSTPSKPSWRERLRPTQSSEGN